MTWWMSRNAIVSFFFQAEDGIRDLIVTGVQTCALPISDAWTVFVATSAWTLARRSCIACACFIRLPRLPRLPNMPLSDIRSPFRVLQSAPGFAFRLQRGAAVSHLLDLAPEDREGLLNERVGEGFIAKMALPRRFALLPKLRGRRRARSALQ